MQLAFLPWTGGASGDAPSARPLRGRQGRHFGAGRWSGLTALSGLVLAGVLSSGCASRGEPGGSPETGSIAFESIARGSRSGIHEPRRVVIRDPQAFAALWAEHTRGESPPRPLPEVDFATSLVVGVFAGTRSSSGHGVEIVSCRETAAGRRVEYVETKPAPGTITLSVMTHPFHLVRMSRFAGEFEFHLAAE